MNAHKETLGLHDRHKERVCAKEREDISIVERREMSKSKKVNLTDFLLFLFLFLFLIYFSIFYF